MILAGLLKFLDATNKYTFFVVVHLQKAQQWCLPSQTHPLHIHNGLGLMSIPEKTTDTPPTFLKDFPTTTITKCQSNVFFSYA